MRLHDGTLLLGRLVTSNYFQLLGAGAEIGRTLTPGDSPAVGGNAVVVLSNAAWRSRFGSDPAIVGKRVRLGRDTFDVVGAEGELALLVRGRVDNASVKAAVMAAVEAVDPDAPFQFYSLREMLGAQVWIVRMISTVASVLGALGLAFAFSGTYAVVAFLVTARTREFGIRLALGGTVPQIVMGILGEMLRITSVGLAGGLILAFGLVRFISGATPMILPFGAPPYLIGALVVVLAAATAALLPSLRAGRIDPSAALRAE
jgi:hypothetical protein